MIMFLSIVFLSSCSDFAFQTAQPIQTLDTPTTASNTELPVEKLSLTPTPVPTTTKIDFPSWMSNPDTAVLAAYIRDDIVKSLKIQFFSAATGEKFELAAFKDFGWFFWYDNQHFGIVSKDLNSTYKFDLQTGKVSTDTTPFEAPDDHWKRIKSSNGQYTAELDADDKIITVKDAKTTNVMWELTLPENRYGTELLWSPVNETHLAFLQGSPALNGNITGNMTLTIVDIATREILATYDGNFGVMEWSPDGKMILYLAPSFRYRNYGIPFKDAPCLLILTTGEKKCLRSIPRLVPVGYNLSTTGIYSWAEDSNSIFYTYEYILSPSDHYEILGNLCNYSLLDSRITCPTQDLEILHGNHIVFYDLSPDKKFIHFCYSDSSLMSDASGTSNDGIIEIDGSGFFSWVGTIIDGGPFEACSIETFWRPLP